MAPWRLSTLLSCPPKATAGGGRTALPSFIKPLTVHHTLAPTPLKRCPGNLSFPSAKRRGEDPTPQKMSPSWSILGGPVTSDSQILWTPLFYFHEGLGRMWDGGRGGGKGRGGEGRGKAASTLAQASFKQNAPHTQAQPARPPPTFPARGKPEHEIGE